MISKCALLSFCFSLGVALPSFAGNCLYSIQLQDEVTRGAIALTFDDGPEPRSTPLVLDLLKKHNIKASFFLVANNAKAHPEIVRRIKAEGHLIANHSLDHKDFHKLTEDKVAEEIIASDAILRDIVGPVDLFRFPQGFSTCFGREILSKTGYRYLGWNIDTCDWVFADGNVSEDERKTCDFTKKGKEDFLVEETFKRVDKYGGGVLLMHDIHMNTYNHLEEILTGLEERGYKFILPNDKAYFPKLLSTEVSRDPASEYPPVIPADLVQQDLETFSANVYNHQFVSKVQNGKPALVSRILRGYMTRHCVDMQTSDYLTYQVTEWIGTPLSLCKYSITDKDADGKTLRKKEVPVIVLKLNEILLADWITNTCVEIGQLTERCMTVISNQLLMQSSGQFPVRGIVYEDNYIKNTEVLDGSADKYGQDNLYEPFCFREGVTVYTDAFNDRSTDELTEEQITECMSGALTTLPRKVGTHLRLQGTSPAMYKRWGGTRTNLTRQITPMDVFLDPRRKINETISTEEWLVAAREEMILAVKDRKNFMLTAWAKANLKKFK